MTSSREPGCRRRHCRSEWRGPHSGNDRAQPSCDRAPRRGCRARGIPRRHHLASSRGPGRPPSRRLHEHRPGRAAVPSPPVGRGADRHRRVRGVPYRRPRLGRRGLRHSNCFRVACRTRFASPRAAHASSRCRSVRRTTVSPGTWRRSSRPGRGLTTSWRRPRSTESAWGDRAQPVLGSWITSRGVSDQPKNSSTSYWWAS